jgi:hypothetical protein
MGLRTRSYLRGGDRDGMRVTQFAALNSGKREATQQLEIEPKLLKTGQFPGAVR